MEGGRGIGEETRNIMMQNLFGEQSEEEEEEDEEEEPEPEEEDDADYGREGLSSHQPQPGGYHSEEGEGEVDVEGQGEVEVGSEDELRELEPDQGESEAERASSPEREGSELRAESGGREAESEDQAYGQRGAPRRGMDVSSSESERSKEVDPRFLEDAEEDEEVDQASKERSPIDGEREAVVRHVFGDSEEDEPADYGAQEELEPESHRSPTGEDEIYEGHLRPEDIVPDEEFHESEDENLEQKTKEKLAGPPLDLEIPLRRPPGQPHKMNMIKVSNIMGIEPKPFDPKTYVEEDAFITDESGTKKRIRLEDNIVRWRKVQNCGGASCESNARFVRWSDGSLQLLIGNEVLDITMQEAQHDHAHLFLRHEKGILQSQGKLLHKMRFMPSSLSSKSHRLLTALVDSRHKKVYKVKNCITEIDPEREKEEKEKAEGQTIRANELLQRKREKVSKKYTPSVDRGRQLSPGYLEEAWVEDEEPEEYYSSHRAAARRRFEEDMELESHAERRIINAKKSRASGGVPRKASTLPIHPSRPTNEEYSDYDREESEYETDGDEGGMSPTNREPESDHEDEYDEYEEPEDEVRENAPSEDEEEELRSENMDDGDHSRKRREIDSDVESPPRKAAAHRRRAIVYDSDED